MPKLRLQDLLRPTTTPEQANFLDWFYSFFDNGSAAHKKILNVVPLFYMGTIVATEFLVYSVNKLYIGYKVIISKDSGGIQILPPFVIYNDEFNNDSMLLGNFIAYYNTVVPTAYYSSRFVEVENIYFSCAAVTLYDTILFNGYRVTLN
jgi:hypothetical protein